MRYTIVINQLAIVQHNLNVTLEEVIILDYLYWLCKSDNTKLIRLHSNDLLYTWFDYNYFLKQNPLIRWKSKSCITKKLHRLEKDSFIQTQTSGDYINRKYVAVLSKTELIYGDEHHKQINKKTIKNEKCEWCHNTVLPLVDHHFPIPRAQQGTAKVRICTACHAIYHDTNTALSAEERQKYTISKIKQMLFPKENSTLFPKENSTLFPKENSTLFPKENGYNNTNKDNTTNNKQISEIYELYTANINSKSRLTSSAKKKIETRLKEFSIKDLTRAIMNFSRDRWWITHNAQRGVAWFFNSEDRIDQFLNLEPEDRKEKLRL